MKALSAIIALSWVSFWWSPDQAGQRHFDEGAFAEAGEAFIDPLWKGAALYRDGQFKEALQVYSMSSTAEAYYNRGNCQVFLGQYDAAIESYGFALKERPDWKEALENQELARRRAKLLDTQGGDFGDQKLGADKIVFDRKKSDNEGQDTQISKEQAVSDAQVQSLWLRRIQTRPADFLQMKFAYQASGEESQP